MRSQECPWLRMPSSFSPARNCVLWSLSTEVGVGGGGRSRGIPASCPGGVEGGKAHWASQMLDLSGPGAQNLLPGCSGPRGGGAGSRLRPSPPGTFCYYLPPPHPSHRSKNAASALSWVPSCGPQMSAQVFTFGCPLLTLGCALGVPTGSCTGSCPRSKQH